MVKVLLADDHALIRRVVRDILEREDDMEVVGEASNGLEVESLTLETKPDVILMDLDMPGCDGFEATQRVLASSPGTRVVFLTASPHEQHAFQAIQCGATGYLTKDIEPETLVVSIRRAAHDELCMPRVLAARVLAHMRTLTQQSSKRAFLRERTQTALSQENFSPSINFGISASPPETSEEASDQIRPLTFREREILDLIRKGRKNREIAGELQIAESTVHKHVQNIFEKLHARNRTEAIYLSSTL